MINQLCLFPEEANYLTEKVPAKHFRSTGEIEYISDLFVNRRGELFSSKTSKLKKIKTTISQGYSKFGFNRKMYLAHRIVACTFLHNNNREKKTQIDHLDGVKTNNHIFNLEWVTPRQNLLRIKNSKNERQTVMF